MIFIRKTLTTLCLFYHIALKNILWRFNTSGTHFLEDQGYIPLFYSGALTRYKGNSHFNPLYFFSCTAFLRNLVLNYVSAQVNRDCCPRIPRLRFSTGKQTSCQFDDPQMNLWPKVNRDECT